MKQENIQVSNVKTSAVLNRINYEPQRALINEYNVMQPQKVNKYPHHLSLCMFLCNTTTTTSR